MGGFIAAMAVGGVTVATQVHALADTVDGQRVASQCEDFVTKIGKVLIVLHQQSEALGQIQNGLQAEVGHLKKAQKICSDWNGTTRESNRLKKIMQDASRKAEKLRHDCDSYTLAACRQTLPQLC